jgi:hypothetical protein
MVETETKTGIVIRDIVSEEVLDKLDTRPLEKALEAIDLSKYGTGVREINFFVVALPPENTLHKNEVLYDRRKRKLTLELNLSYPHVLKANNSEVLRMTAKLFLSSIDLYPQLKVRDFDLRAFKSGIEELFEVRGW